MNPNSAMTVPPCETPHLTRSKQRQGEWVKKIMDDIPMHRRGGADELAGLAVLLASDASSYITGQVFVQDGGRSVKH